MKNRHIIICLVAILLLFSCSQTVKSLDEGSADISNLEHYKGYLLIGVETQHSLKNISLNGPDNIRLSHTDLKKGSNFILIPLESGEYNITDIAYNYYVKSKMIGDKTWSFTIKPQTISYVGHLEIETQNFYRGLIHIELVNRSTEALDFMESKFSSILGKRDMFYGGPGEDHYFEYLKEVSH